MITEKRKDELVTYDLKLHIAKTQHNVDEAAHWKRMIKNWHLEQSSIDSGIKVEWLWLFSVHNESSIKH